VLGACTAATGAAAGPTPSSFATQWISYAPGAGVPLSFQNPNAALGEPTRFSGVGIDPGVVSPFQPAFMPSEVVSIGPGGSLIVAFDHDVIDDPLNPFGIDLIVFGNSFFADDSFPLGVCGFLFSEGGEVALSEDGSVWHTVPGVMADGPLPTLGYLDAGPYDTTPGSVPSDFSRPVDPALAAGAGFGTSFDELLEIYDGSGGGAGIDLAWVGLAKARFVRIRVPLGWCCTAEVDGVAAVRAASPEFAPADLDRNGVINGADLATLLGHWGGNGTLENGASADLNGDGVVNGADLALLLGAWS